MARRCGRGGLRRISGKGSAPRGWLATGTGSAGQRPNTKPEWRQRSQAHGAILGVCCAQELGSMVFVGTSQLQICSDL